MISTNIALILQIFALLNPLSSLLFLTAVSIEMIAKGIEGIIRSVI